MLEMENRLRKVTIGLFDETLGDNISVEADMLHTSNLMQDPVIIDSTVLKRLVDNLDRVDFALIKNKFRDLIRGCHNMDDLLGTLESEIDFHRSIEAFNKRCEEKGEIRDSEVASFESRTEFEE